MSKKLVAYFSATGTTAKVAEILADAIGANLYEIEPVVPYTQADLDWMDKQSRSTIEMNDKTFRPAITDTDASIAEYDCNFRWLPDLVVCSTYHHQYSPGEVRFLRQEDRPVRYFRWKRFR